MLGCRCGFLNAGTPSPGLLDTVFLSEGSELIGTRHNVEPVRLPMTAQCMPSPVQQIPGRATNVSMLLQILTKYHLFIIAPTIDYYILIPEKKTADAKKISPLILIEVIEGYIGVYRYA